MQLFLKVAAGLVTAMFFFLGLSAYFDPAGILAQGAFAWQPDGIAGLSGARSVIGGHFLGLAVVAVYGFMTSQYKLFYVIAVSELLIAGGRFLSLGLDGYDARIVAPLIIELIMAGTMFACGYLLKSAPVEPAATSH